MSPVVQQQVVVPLPQMPLLHHPNLSGGAVARWQRSSASTGYYGSSHDSDGARQPGWGGSQVLGVAVGQIFQPELQPGLWPVAEAPLAAGVGAAGWSNSERTTRLVAQTHGCTRACTSIVHMCVLQRCRRRC